MTDVLPFRFRLLEFLESKGKTTPQEAYESLMDEYGEMRYFKIGEISDHFMSMCANGIAEEIDVALDENDQLVSTYAITDYGRELLAKYLPKKT